MVEINIIRDSKNRDLAAILPCGCVLYADLSLQSGGCREPESHEDAE